MSRSRSCSVISRDLAGQQAAFNNIAEWGAFSSSVGQCLVGYHSTRAISSATTIVSGLYLRLLCHPRVVCCFDSHRHPLHFPQLPQCISHSFRAYADGENGRHQSMAGQEAKWPCCEQIQSRRKVHRFIDKSIIEILRDVPHRKNHLSPDHHRRLAPIPGVHHRPRLCKLLYYSRLYLCGSRPANIGIRLTISHFLYLQRASLGYFHSASFLRRVKNA